MSDARRSGAIGDASRSGRLIERADDSAYRVFNIHLSPHDLREERRAETVRISELARSFGDAPPPIVVGDFNDQGSRDHCCSPASRCSPHRRPTRRNDRPSASTMSWCPLGGPGSRSRPRPAGRGGGVVRPSPTDVAVHPRLGRGSRLAREGLLLLLGLLGLVFFAVLEHTLGQGASSR